jgi:integrase
MAIRENSRESAKIRSPGSKLVARRKFHFTRERIEALPLPANGQRSYFYDAKVRGLAIAVSPLGKKTFILYRKVSGRPERITIGPFVDLSIDQARTRAEEMNGAIALGTNPAKERRRVRDEMTLGELFAKFIEEHAKERKKTWADDVGTFNLHLHKWKLRKISSIGKEDVILLHRRIGQGRGRYAANRVVELLCTIFNLARERWGWNRENPAANVQPYPERKRERFLQGDELPAFFESLAQEVNETVRDYVFISLLTGARRSNVQEMRWLEISWDRATWRIPQTKSGEPQTVALSPIAIRILETRRAASLTQWVFPGTGRSGHLVEPKTAWKRILKRAGIEDLRLHDLRRTLGSWQAATGASLPVIGKSLGHKSLAATQIYAHLELDPVRASVNRATDAMLLAGSFQPLTPLLEGK